MTPAEVDIDVRNIPRRRSHAYKVTRWWVRRIFWSLVVLVGIWLAAQILHLIVPDTVQPWTAPNITTTPIGEPR